MTTLATPLVFAYFALRGIRDRAYLERWRERFGFLPACAKPGGVLLHAASVGEFNAAGPLVRALLEAYPGVPLTVTTLTPTGAERVRKVLGGEACHSYAPLDLPGAVSRFLGRLQPRLIIVMETEIWPNLYLRAKRLGIPLILANARLSQRSLGRLRWLSGVFGEALASVAWTGAQTQEDAARLVACGAVAGRLEITGNLKFDLDVAPGLEGKGAALRARWGAARPVLVAGSTHEADERVLVPAFLALLQDRPDALLILAPRHRERFAQAARLAVSSGLRTELRSHGEACSAAAQCFVIDSIGELMTYYACADVVFVGGSLGGEGGHNPLEPAVLGKPVLVGPNTDNAREVVMKLLGCGAARRIASQEDLRAALEEIVADGALRERMGRAGRALVENNRGALASTLAAVRRLL